MVDECPDDGGPSEPVELPLDGALDLHTFSPKDVGDLLPEWMAACQERGILRLRVVHGKGTGALRRSVHAILARSPLVKSFRACDEGAGGWGATLVELSGPLPVKPPSDRSPPAGGGPGPPA